MYRKDKKQLQESTKQGALEMQKQGIQPSWASKTGFLEFKKFQLWVFAGPLKGQFSILVKIAFSFTSYMLLGKHS